MCIWVYGYMGIWVYGYTGIRVYRYIYLCICVCSASVYCCAFQRCAGGGCSAGRRLNSARLKYSMQKHFRGRDLCTGVCSCAHLHHAWLTGIRMRCIITRRSNVGVVRSGNTDIERMLRVVYAVYYLSARHHRHSWKQVSSGHSEPLYITVPHSIHMIWVNADSTAEYNRRISEQIVVQRPHNSIMRTHL